MYNVYFYFLCIRGLSIILNFSIFILTVATFQSLVLYTAILASFVRVLSSAF